MYKYRFKNFFESESLDNCLNKTTIKSISLKNIEPIWLNVFRINSLKYLNCMIIPKWSFFNVKKFENIIFYSAPLKFTNNIIDTFEKDHNISQQTNEHSSNTAVDLVLDSISINSSYYRELAKLGIIFTNF